MSQHHYYNTKTFPNLVAKTDSDSPWEIRANRNGTHLASVATKAGYESSHYGDRLHIAKLLRDYPHWDWQLTPYGRELLEPLRRICGEGLEAANLING